MRHCPLMGLWPLHTKGYTHMEFEGALAFATIGRFLNLRVATHAPKPPKTFQGWNLAGNRETGATHFMETSAQPKVVKTRLNRILKEAHCLQDQRLKNGRLSRNGAHVVLIHQEHGMNHAS